MDNEQIKDQLDFQNKILAFLVRSAKGDELAIEELEQYVKSEAQKTNPHPSDRQKIARSLHINFAQLANIATY